MIDLSKYKIGQRFRTRGGDVATLLTYDEFDVFYPLSVQFESGALQYRYNSEGVCRRWVTHGDDSLDLIRPIIPANTRRITSIQLDPVLEKAV